MSVDRWINCDSNIITGSLQKFYHLRSYHVWIEGYIYQTLMEPPFTTSIFLDGFFDVDSMNTEI